MKEIPKIKTTVKNPSDPSGFWIVNLYEERKDFGCTTVFKLNDNGNQHDIGYYHPEDVLLETESKNLVNYLITYKEYKLISVVPKTTGIGNWIRGGAGDSSIETKMVYILQSICH